MNACCGPCRQGRDKCPTPTACRIPDDVLEEWADEPLTTPDEAMGWVPSWSLVTLVAVVFVLVMVASAIGPLPPFN